MERFISPTERLAYADRRLKEGIKPEIVAEECGYKNKASLQACIHTYRSTKRASIDATEPPEKPDYMQAPVDHKTMANIHKNDRSVHENDHFVHEIADPAQQKASSYMSDEAPPLEPIDLPPIEDLDLPSVGTVIPKCLQVTALKGICAEYRLSGDMMDIRLKFDHGLREDYLSLIEEISNAVELLLPEVSNEPA